MDQHRGGGRDRVLMWTAALRWEARGCGSGGRGAVVVKCGRV
ncbi:hypothetical protein DB32_007289 [Sandaracinus amylolyticus]|uniref:Uncharacterized protein n=1 Tax=Sandaracinus amylolyticus TaxID=927083 RepID=A0A0F6W8N3_9BACT|nr:hypothetical protein DB32_007289 [Sandaracinus amylolyticus]